MVTEVSCILGAASVVVHKSVGEEEQMQWRWMETYLLRGQLFVGLSADEWL